MDIPLWEGRKFYEYYQITRSDDDDDADEFGSEIKGELKSHMEGSHSLFGIIWSIQKETGWSHDYVMWGESWFNIQMKLADAPRLEKEKKKIIEDSEELEDLLNND